MKFLNAQFLSFLDEDPYTIINMLSMSTAIELESTFSQPHNHHVIFSWSCWYLAPISLALTLLQLVIQLLSHAQLFVTPWTAAHQASLSSTISWSFLKLMSIELVMLCNHLILCHSLLLCLQSFSASESFLMSQLLHQVVKILELQHQSLQCILWTASKSTWP